MQKNTEIITTSSTEVIIASFHNSSATSVVSFNIVVIWLKTPVIYLQNEDKVVHRFVSLEEVVLRSMFVLGVELEFLHNAGMFDETQQDLL